MKHRHGVIWLQASVQPGVWQNADANPGSGAKMLQTDDGKVVRTSLISLSEIPDGGAQAVDATIDGEPQSLVLTRVGDRVAAFLNVCPHAGRRLDWAPGRFLFEQGELICAVHGARFRPMTGDCVGGPCRGASLKSVAVAVHDGVVFLAG
jgi:nitrite reductase/ring-hydroxylating ferredoxin subunit